MSAKRFVLYLTACLTAVFAALPAASQAKSPEPQGDLAISYYPRYYSYSTAVSRTPKLTLLSNVELKANELSAHVHFSDREGKAIPARFKPAKPEEIAKAWQSMGSPDTESPPARFFLTAEPSRPLPVGTNWKLVFPAGLHNPANTYSLKRALTIYAGTIKAFEVRGFYPLFPYDGSPHIDIGFSKSLDPALNDLLANYVSVSPRPENFRLTQNQRTITLWGDFEFGKEYGVYVKAGLGAQDQTELAGPSLKKLKFYPKRAFVTLPDYEVAQPLAGTGQFEIHYGNLRNLEIRVKELSGDALIYAMRGYRIYDPESVDRKRGQRYPAFEMVPGKTVYSRDIPSEVDINRTEDIKLTWSELFTDGGPTAFYVCAEGDAKEHPHMDKHRVGAQSIVQITDLGVVWKKRHDKALAYVFSLRSGQSVAGASLRLIDGENTTLGQYYTDHSGVAQLNLTGANAAAKWLVATKDKDRYATAFDAQSSQSISSWRFDVRQRYREEPLERLRTFLFSDRGIYKPGETVHMKAITRLADGETLRAPADGQSFAAQLTVEDSRGMEFLTRGVNFSNRGAMDVSFELPAGNLGTYTARLDFEGILGKNPRSRDEEEHWDRWAYHYFTVAEYRPNSFEVALENAAEYYRNEPIEVPIRANYYRGKPLSKARASWYASYQAEPFRPTGFEDYSFGAAQPDVRGSEAGEIELAQDGRADIALDFVPAADLDQPVAVSCNVDVTDINQQTISRSAEFLVHSSDRYLGVKAPKGWLEAGDEVAVGMMAISCAGKPLMETVPARLTVERKAYRTVKLQSAGGAIRHRNEVYYEPAGSWEVEVGRDGKPTEHKFVLKDSGAYRIRLEGKDAAGKPLCSESQCYLWGSDNVYWALRDGDAIELVADKDRYTVGDTARITVRSPILGTALITTERAGVYQTYTRQLTSKNQFLDLPITKRDAPNVYVSVLVVRGSQDSPHKFKDTDYKLGYCELQVERPSDHLDITVEMPADEVLPGREVDIAAVVRDSAGDPVQDAEITLYAVDEGVLSLTNYRTPNPGPVFHASYPLSVYTWHSIFNVLTEDASQRGFENKGLLIGGGGADGAGLQHQTRKDFRATAFWRGSLITDETGRARTSFKAPDSLTTYKVFAVAMAGAERFGSASGKVVVNKPIIVEPALPAFANVGDEMLIQAVVHNTTDKPGSFEVSLQADQRIELLGNDFRIIPAAIGNTKRAHHWSHTLDLAAGASTGLPIPVRFVESGQAKWQWSIRQVGGAALSDSVQSKLDIGYPVPILSETHSLSIDPGRPADLLAAFGNRDLLDGQGQIDATISNSRMLDAFDALNYNLDYPYGCVEQTTSSTLPWMTMNSLEEVFPQLKKSDQQKQKAINYGLNRILSMQTHDGGLAYWPGGAEPEFWASAYGGMALALGQRQGVKLPDSRLDVLWDWLSKQLRSEADAKVSPSQYHQQCLALYTLALAGRPEPAYHELLYQKQGNMAPESRAILALAILEAGNAEQESLARGLLGPNPAADAPKQAVAWYGQGLPLAAKLMAWSQLGAADQTSQLLSQLLRLRRPGRGWGSTYSNAWPLLALARLADSEAQQPGAAEIRLAFGRDAQTIRLQERFASGSAAFLFNGNVRDRKMTVAARAESPLFAHLRLASRPSQFSTAAHNQGFGIKRTYYRLDPSGEMTETNHFEVGDLVVVRLDLDIPVDDQEYLAIEDPFPAIFEGLNPAFKNRANAELKPDWGRYLHRDFEEMRTGRALFFADRVTAKDDYRIEYLARVVAAGSATAPAAKIEAMYEPQRHGLSATTRVTSVLPEPAQVIAGVLKTGPKPGSGSQDN